MRAKTQAIKDRLWSPKVEYGFYHLKALLTKNLWIKKHHGLVGVALELLFPIIMVREAKKRGSSLCFCSNQKHSALVALTAACMPGFL